jgi:NADPH:quinone reductase-like Zn-dependent oxidoreductase
LTLREVPMPVPGPSEVLIAVEAAGVAFGDVMLRLGFHPRFKPPVTPGYDVVGHVVALGDQVEGLVVGSRVAAFLGVGGYATHVVADASWVVEAPPHPPAEAVAAAILNYITAYQMLVRNAQVERGDTILVHGAGGGVGTALLDLARVMGLSTLGTASQGKHKLVEQLGARAIDYAREDFVAIARQEGGVRAVFDHVGGAHLLRSLRALRPSGTVVSYGAQAVFKNGRMSPLGAAKAVLSRIGLDPMRLLSQGQGLIGYSIGAFRDNRNRAFREDFQAVMALLAQGKVSPVIDRVLPLAEAAAAQVRLERAQASGKIVLSMANGDKPR